MSFLKRLRRTLSSEPQPDSDALWLYARCQRCGEVITTRISLRSDLSILYDASGQPGGYHVRKVLVGGRRRCYQAVEVHLTFDAARRLVNREISGGEFITAEEYAAESSGNQV